MKSEILKKLAAVAVLCAVCISAFAAQARELKPVKYVFLFIGDGMSIPQRMMTDEYLKLSGQKELLINALPNNAVTYTRSANSFITDSAASGTAIACGGKTNNGRVGVSATGERFESVAEAAKKNGRKVGVITSVTINHATPAAFYAHNDSRGNYYKIALDMIASNFDFFGGGGIGSSYKSEAGGKKSDAYKLAEEAGYKVFRGKKALDGVKKGCGKVMAFASDGALPYAIDDPSGPRIAEFTQKAIEVLDNPEGFFIMVEGGKIDWMCHANDAATVIGEVLDFDRAVKVALDFQKAHPYETLVVVTGDHETGGLTLGFAGTGYASHIQLLANQKNSRDVTTNKFRKILAADADMTFEKFRPAITEAFGFKFSGDAKKDRMVLSQKEIAKIRDSFDKNIKDKKPESKNVMKFVNTLILTLDNKASIGWTSNAHTALPVSTTAAGAQSGAFNGTIDNTDIAKLLKQAVK